MPENDISEILRKTAGELQPDLVRLRRDLHAHPEKGLDLPRTQAAVLDAIDGLDLEISRGEGLTSVTAVLRGGRPGPAVLLRADMDALSLTEATGLDYVVRDSLGAERFDPLDAPVAAAEDFSLVLNEVPGCFLFLGATASGDPATAPSNHSPHAVFDDSVLADASFLLAELARRALDRLAAS
jgi:metal-dependent amidase/aminoacylase/carboxypeptidase family protein